MKTRGQSLAMVRHNHQRVSAEFQSKVDSDATYAYVFGDSMSIDEGIRAKKGCRGCKSALRIRELDKEVPGLKAATRSLPANTCLSSAPGQQVIMTFNLLQMHYLIVK